MTLKKNPKNQLFIEIDVWKAAGIIATALLTTAVGTAFTLIRVLNSDHFIIASHTARIEAMENTFIPRVEVETGFMHIGTRLDRIESKLDRVIENK